MGCEICLVEMQMNERLMNWRAHRVNAIFIVIFPHRVPANRGIKAEGAQRSSTTQEAGQTFRDYQELWNRVTSTLHKSGWCPCVIQVRAIANDAPVVKFLRDNVTDWCCRCRIICAICCECAHALSRSNTVYTNCMRIMGACSASGAR